MIPRQPQPASQEQLNTWWKQFKGAADPQARDRLAEHYWPIVHYMAQRMKVRLAGQVDMDDLVSAGSLGLLSALAGFDLSRGIKFETFCKQRIQGAMLDELRSEDWVPRLVRKRSRQVQNATQLFQASAGRRPDEPELAHALKLSIPWCRRVARDAQVALRVPLALTAKVEDNEGEIALPADSAAESPDRGAQRREIKGLLASLLSRIQLQVVILYYYEEMSQKEIGATLAMSESRVCQVLATTLALVRSRLDPRTMRLSA